MSETNKCTNSGQYKMNEQCSNCKFGFVSPTDIDGDKTFQCLRFPPVIDVVHAIESNKFGSHNFAEDSPIYWASPIVYESHWCGEYIRREVIE